MPYRNNDEAARANRRKHYKANSASYIARAKAQKAAVDEAIRALKAAPCSDCGQSFHFAAMDFDHRPGVDKKFNMARHNGSMRLVLEEIAKCDLVCSNCHRVRTYERQ